MTISHRLWIAVFALCAAFAVTVGAAWLGYQTARAADYVVLADAEIAAPSHPYRDTLIAQADTGSAADASTPDAAAPTASSTTEPGTPVQLQASDVGLVTKLYKNGAFFGLGIMVVFVGLTIWSKLDKKRAFYAATLLGGIGLLVESIRRGDTPNATMLYSTLGPTIGILIAGPNHVKAPKEPAQS